MKTFQNIWDKKFQIICLALICSIIWMQYSKTTRIGSKENIGNVLYSSPLADDIKGYAGPISIAIFIDDEKKVETIEVIEHFETPSFMRALEKKDFFDNWKGMSVSEGFAKKVDTISGATRTSSAVIEIVRKTLSGKDNIPPVEKVNGQSKIKAILKNGLFVLAICFSLLIFFRPVIFGRYRDISFLINVIVLGYLTGEMFSLQLFVGWLKAGVSLNLLFGLFLLVVVLCLFFNKNVYCSGICPYGCMQMLAGKFCSKKAKDTEGFIRTLKVLRRVLFLLIAYVILAGLRFDLNNVEPFSAFMVQRAGVGAVSVFIVFLILSIFSRRPWCSICPTGAIFRALVKRVKISKLYKLLIAGSLFFVFLFLLGLF